MRTMPAITALFATAAPASAQLAAATFLINDRGNDAIWAVRDADTSGSIGPGEHRAWFDATNLSGIVGPDNPTALAARFDAEVLMGDQGLGAIFRLRDVNGDGDALDAGEAILAADPANASGVSLAFPTGIGFDSVGRRYVVNAGNAFGHDAIYALTDLNADGDFQDAGEITTFVGEPFFGPGNGPYSPQEIIFYPTAVVTLAFLRNSSSGLHGVYRFIDADMNGRGDDPGEFSTYFDAANASGVTVGAGFAIDLDHSTGGLYVHQLAAGSEDQVIRLVDLNGDDDAQDPGEAEVVFSTTEANFTSIDIVSLPSGEVLLTDNSGKRVITLVDIDGDGRFMSPGERTDYVASPSAFAADVRQMAMLPLSVCYPDCDGSGGLDLFDFLCFVSAFNAGNPYADCDGSGGLDLFDFLCFVSAFNAGCP